jgi:hypothetical protein
MKAARELLGLSESAYSQYEKGVRRGSGEPVELPRWVGLACSAIAAGLEPFDKAPRLLVARQDQDHLLDLLAAGSTLAGTIGDQLADARAAAAGLGGIHPPPRTRRGRPPGAA